MKAGAPGILLPKKDAGEGDEPSDDGEETDDHRELSMVYCADDESSVFHRCRRGEHGDGDDERRLRG